MAENVTHTPSLGYGPAANCPLCGQRTLVRHGALLSPKLADIFDMIERSGRRGVLPGVLASVFYPNQSNKAARRALAVSISHINDKLVETDLRVRMAGRFEPYRVVKVRVRIAA